MSYWALHPHAACAPSVFSSLILPAPGLCKASSWRRRERAEAERRAREALEAAQARAAELDSENRALRGHKYDLDARVSELSHKLGAAEGSNRCVWVYARARVHNVQ